jgi:hypothetical protein
MSNKNLELLRLVSQEAQVTLSYIQNGDILEGIKPTSPETEAMFALRTIERLSKAREES